jgi:hypothetical protein
MLDEVFRRQDRLHPISRTLRTSDFRGLSPTSLEHRPVTVLLLLNVAFLQIAVAAAGVVAVRP